MIGEFLTAVAFLTRLPVPTRPAAIQRSVRWFPLVGLMLGSIYTGTAWLLLHRLPAAVVTILVIALDALLTGALHLDGLADMADGFGGGTTREDVLRIMRDHAIGAYGATALILILLLKAVTLTQLLTTGRIWILFPAPTLARWSILLLSRIAPYARPAGTGSLCQSVTTADLAVATASCFPLFFLPGTPQILFSWTIVSACTVLLARLSCHRIGGFTGDVLGANTLICESLVLLIPLFL